MSLKKKPRYRHSWKKPWAFSNIHDMRKTLTEREVYKKLKILERHSSFKKPYYNYQAHPHGELYYSPSGFPPGGGNPIGPFDPYDPPPPGGGCAMACLGGMLDCEQGGCESITCICAVEPLLVTILEDPSGQAWVEYAGGVRVVAIPGERSPLAGAGARVCIPPLTIDEDYGTIVVEIIDAVGALSIVEIDLVDCKACCDEFTLTGDDTVNGGSTWVGTISPACPGATCTVVSNSGCELSCNVNSAGSEVSVGTLANQCGTFTVTVTSPNPDDCEVFSDSKGVRLDGGTWRQPVDCCAHSVFCSACCSPNTVECDVGSCTGWVSVSPPPASQMIEDDDGNWYKIGNGAACVNRPECRPCNTGGPTNRGCIPYGGCYGSCDAAYEYIWGYDVCEWSCDACPP